MTPAGRHPEQQQVPPRSGGPGDVLLWCALVLAGLAGSALGIRQIESPDLGFHLGTARWILEQGWVPWTDPFTYTVADHAYIDLQWLFQLLAYGLVRIGGTALIILATTALTLLFAATLLVRLRRRGKGLTAGAVVLVLLFFLGNHWEPRPHLLSWLFGSLLLLVLEEHGRGSRRWLPLLPLIMLLWVNSHSLFILGVVILGAHVAAGLLVALIRKEPVDRPLLAWSAAAVIACLLNPYHVHGLLFPLTQFMDIQAGSAYKSTLWGIGEFTSPFGFSDYVKEGRFILFQPRLWWQLFTVLALVGLWRERRRLRLVDWILCLGFLYIFSQANKNFGYFVMVLLPLAASGLRGRTPATSGLAHGVPGRTVLAVVALALLVGAWSGRLADLAWSPTARGLGFNRAVLPVGACEFINKQKIRGRILNTWDQGGYITWATGQKVFTYSHGEVTGDEFYNRYVQAKQPGGLSGGLEKWMPDIAVVPFNTAPYWLYNLSRHKQWRLAYRSGHTAVYLHRFAARKVPALSSPEPGKDYPAYTRAQLRKALPGLLRKPGPGLGQWLQGRGAYPVREMALSSFHLQTGQLEAAAGLCLAGQERTPFLVPDLALNLGHLLNHWGRYRLADKCFAAFLRVDGDPHIAADIQRVKAARK